MHTIAHNPLWTTDWQTSVPSCGVGSQGIARTRSYASFAYDMMRSQSTAFFHSWEKAALCLKLQCILKSILHETTASEVLIARRFLHLISYFPPVEYEPHPLFHLHLVATTSVPTSHRHAGAYSATPPVPTAVPSCRQYVQRR